MDQPEDLAAVYRRLEQLEQQVLELKSEIDECRRDNLRIAELYDMTVERLGRAAADGR